MRYITYSQTKVEEYALTSAPINVKAIPKSQFLSCIVQQIIEINDKTLEKVHIEMLSSLNFSITISAAGDCILGTDESFTYPGSFTETFDQNGGDYSYFMRNVRDIFSEDDLTIANLETPLTTATKKADKQFRFKGDPSYVNILKAGSIETVNIANNHTYDYFEEGYTDTLKSLQEGAIGLFGADQTYITWVKGIKIGVLGYTGWNSSMDHQEKIDIAITSLKNQQCQLIIVFFHWGEERMNYPNETQKTLGHLAIDSGADLVIGCHPHVVQGIENYGGKYIVYSLGNFCFGGNENPDDKDTFIFQQTFFFSGQTQTKDALIKLIPCSISSVKERNDYQPTPLVGDEADRVIDRINLYSEALNFSY